MIQQQHDDGADDGDEHRDEIEVEHVEAGQLTEEKSADQRADEAERDVDEAALAAVVDDLRRNEARDQSENDPAQYGHAQPPKIAAPVMWSLRAAM